MPYLDSIRVFVRTIELGSITAAGRDQRLTPAVASNRIKELENRLGVRLFNRTTRRIAPTEIGRNYYNYATKVVEALDDAESAIAGFSKQPKGAIMVTAPLGVGRRIIAPLVPEFNEVYPEVDVRLRLSDRKVDLFGEGVDAAFVLGDLHDSNMKVRKISDCPRLLCAAPSYLEKHGEPATPQALIDDNHKCLLLRFPGSEEYNWALQTEDGLRRYNVSGPFDADDGDVLTEWAVAGKGIINKPAFLVTKELKSGALVPILQSAPPPTASFACLYPHRRLQDPKVRLFVDFMIDGCKKRVREMVG
ncbi:MAG: LysR family transcriptional regulator [Rhodobacteraceae bacterium]|nr:LysR family transcriptional regulator [Paracoccaceae bacterium]